MGFSAPGCGGDDAANPDGGAGNGGSAGVSSGQGGSGGNAGVGGEDTPSGEACPNAERAGSLAVSLGRDKTLFSGRIADGIDPSNVFEEVAVDGACRLLDGRNLFCSPACGSGTTCAGDNTCVPTPTKQSAGVIEVTGLLAPLSASFVSITGEYAKTILDPYPAFEPGTLIQASAAGDVFSAFSLRAWGVPPLSTSLTTVNVSPGSSVPLTWDTTGVDPNQSEIFLSFWVNAHGAVTGWIECTVPDTGSFEIPAGLVSTLIDRGLSGFPSLSMQRQSVDSTQLSTGDCVDFRVSSEVTIELTVDGLVSCNSDLDCPMGQTCTELACR